MAFVSCVMAAVLLCCSEQAVGMQMVAKMADVFLTTPEIVTKHGYPIETHTVVTGSGYVLVLHRIPGSPKSPSDAARSPALLYHGIACSSDLWVSLGPEKSLGFLLADQGYDVWLANARGNYYSRNHVTLSPNDKRFWDFSFHEMGVEDLPRIIDYILAETRQQQIFYVGYSMGCTSFFIMASAHPEYNARVRLMVGLAPAVYNGQKNSFSNTIGKVAVNLGLQEILFRTASIDRLLDNACGEGSALRHLCAAYHFSMFGYNPKELNATMLPVIMSNTQSGASIKTVEHFIQIFDTERFQTFDVNAKKNGRTDKTTLYNLQLVTVPVALVYGMNDAIVRPSGVFQLSKKLPNVVKLIQVTDKYASHTDVVFANHVKQLVNDDVIDLMRRY